MKMADYLNAQQISRRTFLKGIAALSFAISAKGLIPIASASTTSSLESVNAWISIGSDNTVNLIFPITELGQGSSTALPMILAEELDADWDTVKIEQLNKDDPTYGNPLFGNVLYTAGSTGVYGYYETLRRAGAQARTYLIAIAARYWGVSPSEITTKPGVVVHSDTNRRLSYGEIAGLNNEGIDIPDIETIALKDPKDFRLIGGDTPRRDMFGKSTGTEVFAFDVEVPEMLYAVVLRTPVEGETVIKINDADTLNVPGVVKTVELPDGVAVVAKTHYAARKGRDALDVTWSNSSPARSYNSEQALVRYDAAVRDVAKPGVEWSAKGDMESAIKAAARTVEATYHSDHAYHAQIEPMATLASVEPDGKGAEIWVGTQTQSWSMHTATQVLGTTKDRVRMHMLPMGGSFGRRTEMMQNYLRDSLLSSKAAGKPVKVLWSREEDIKHGAFRPAAAQHLRAGLTEDNAVSGWHHRVASPSVIEFFNPLRWERVAPKDVITMLGSENRFYDFKDMRAEHVVMDRVARLAPWRGIGASYTAFAAEAFMDELAESAGQDPMKFRMALLQHNPRARAVLESVAKRSGWGRSAKNRALGMAFAGYGNTIAAGVAEISLNRDSGVISVEKFWVAVDAGLIVSPRNAHGQIEGGVIFGISSALKESIRIVEGEVQNENFYNYPIVRSNEVPEIHIEIMKVNEKPSGIGESSTPMVAPAIANAFYALTGKRLRHMPFTPERVLKLLDT
jgi:isoquinoline 1-oxidoreductase beta subunit